MSYVEFKKRKKKKHYLVEEPPVKTYMKEEELKKLREKQYEAIYGPKSYITRKTKRKKGMTRGETLRKRGYVEIKLKGLPWQPIASSVWYKVEDIEAVKTNTGEIIKWSYLPPKATT